MEQQHLFCFGLGYSATVLAEQLLKQGWNVSGTVRRQEKARQLRGQNINAMQWDGQHDPVTIPHDVTHILHSIPPQEGVDTVLADYQSQIIGLSYLTWLGYLSTTGVYGDHKGGWVDEETATNPPNERSKWRVEAEQQWLGLWSEKQVPVHIFRLSGIYGPKRSVVNQLLEGRAKRIDKPGQVFSRIHVEDIAQILQESMHKPKPGSIYNVADDQPAPQQDVVSYAAGLMNVEEPPLQNFATARLSEMARSFYQSNRRVSNKKVKQQLGITLKYPSYYEGIKAIIDTRHNGEE